MPVCITVDTLVSLLEGIGIFSHRVQMALLDQSSMFAMKPLREVEVILQVAQDTALMRESFLLTPALLSNKELGRDYLRSILAPFEVPEGDVITVSAKGRLVFLREVLNALKDLADDKKVVLFRSSEGTVFPSVADHLRSAHYHAVQWGQTLVVKL